MFNHIKKEFLNFIRHVRMGYLLFTSLLIVGVIFGGFEISKEVFFSDTSQETLRWLHFSRGVIVSLMLMVWAAWTVYNYREIYEEKLEVTETKYRDIIEHSADAIISVNNDNIITSWNRGAEEIFGWERVEMLGHSIEDIVPGDLIKEGELDYIDRGLEEQGHVSNYETERLNKEGQRVLVTLSESYIRDENDKIAGRSIIMRDLTDLKIKEQQIQHSERLATVGHMAAGVAHEVGNPLTSISSLVQVSQRKTDDPFIQEQLKKVRDHIQRITKIVRDLVDFSRPSGFHTEYVQVNDIISSSVGLLKHDARCREVNFELNLSPSLPKTVCVPDHIHQVIVNLLLNAVDAMKDSDIKKVTLSSRRVDGEIELTISDTGEGIKEEYRKRIFEPFFTTKKVGQGTGLGLSVSHGIIRQEGGSIRVESEYGEGATFIITLPIKKDPE